MDPIDEDLMYEDMMLLEGQIRDLKAEIAKLRDTVEHYKADAAHDGGLIKELRAALITAVQWMPQPGSEYTEESKADVRQVREALGWITNGELKRFEASRAARMVCTDTDRSAPE
jgi:hypothetical protein